MSCGVSVEKMSERPCKNITSSSMPWGKLSVFMEDSAKLAQRHFATSPSGSSTGILRDWGHPSCHRTIAGLLDTGEEFIRPLSDRLLRLTDAETSQLPFP